MSAFFWIPYQSNLSLKEKNYSNHSFLLVLGKVTVLMYGKILHATVQMGVLILMVLVLINPTVLWHMMTHSEPTLILQMCIDSLPVF